VTYDEDTTINNEQKNKCYYQTISEEEEDTKPELFPTFFTRDEKCSRILASY